MSAVSYVHEEKDSQEFLVSNHPLEIYENRHKSARSTLLARTWISRLQLIHNTSLNNHRTIYVNKDLLCNAPKVELGLGALGIRAGVDMAVVVVAVQQQSLSTLTATQMILNPTRHNRI